mgnify:CR=1 FL=1
MIDLIPEEVRDDFVTADQAEDAMNDIEPVVEQEQYENIDLPVTPTDDIESFLYRFLVTYLLCVSVLHCVCH